jgi:hypothetical protein
VFAVGVGFIPLCKIVKASNLFCSNQDKSNTLRVRIASVYGTNFGRNAIE